MTDQEPIDPQTPNVRLAHFGRRLRALADHPRHRKHFGRAPSATETKSHSPPKAASFGAQIPMGPQLIDDTARVKAGLRKPDEFMLIDTRTWAEFIGETSGYKYHSRKGRIPGSTYGQADFTDTNSLTPYRNIDNTMRNAGEILALWKKSGISTDKHLSFMCGSGWRAAEVLTFARVIGVPNTSLFSDGWIGWSNDRRNPVESDAISGRLK